MELGFFFAGPGKLGSWIQTGQTFTMSAKVRNTPSPPTGDKSRSGRSVAGLDRGIGLMNADSTGRRVVYHSRNVVSELTFTRDGAQVVFVEWAKGHGTERIKIVDFVTNKVEMIPEVR